MQVALALVLLVGSGLMIRTFHALRAIDPGFTDPEHVQLVRVAIPDAQSTTRARHPRCSSDILDALAAFPGVDCRGVHELGADGAVQQRTMRLFVEDQSYGGAARFRRFAPSSSSRPDYFQAIGTPLIAGRDLTWTDLYERRPVALISENLAREIWG